MAYRQRLCPSCFIQRVLPLDKPFDPADELRCPSCGISTEHEMFPVYATSFIPGSGKYALELPLCGDCATNIRAAATENGELLADREPESRGQAPRSTPQETAWNRLGIVPRE